MGRSSGMF
uniref:Uncharacterized protein n=1 Tax=Arundo donax TaxID=35708 RepID=A0A0A9ALT3_ARUDO